MNSSGWGQVVKVASALVEGGLPAEGIVVVIVKQRLVQIGRTNSLTE